MVILPVGDLGAAAFTISSVQGPPFSLLPLCKEEKLDLVHWIKKMSPKSCMMTKIGLYDDENFKKFYGNDGNKEEDGTSITSIACHQP